MMLDAHTSHAARSPGEDPLLDVNDLHVTYRTHEGSVHAVRGIDFSVAPRGALAIVGESGCGKTSVAMALMGLLNARHATVKGQARLAGAGDLPTLPAAALRRVRGNRVGMIFQDPMTSLNPYLRVGLQIREPLDVHRDMSASAARDEAARLLETVGFEPPIGPHLRRYPHELSGGMCQRAMVASALACSPSLLIADEPTTALDVITQDQVLSLIRRKREEHAMALLLITHDLGIVAGTCDHVAVMYAGEIVEYGPIDRIYGHPEHPYTRALLGAVPRLDRPRARRLQTIVSETADTPASVAAATASSTPASPPPPAPASEPVVAVRDLVVTFRDRSALPWRRPATVNAVDHVTLEVASGESLGLVGQSGSGKTTLVRAVLGLLPAAAGSIRCRGRDVTRDDGAAVLRERWRDMQLVFQDPYGSLNSRLTVGETLLRPLRHYRVVPRRERRAEVARLLSLVRIDPSWQNRFPHELSGGQRQRVSIARALAPRPSVLLCDEPVSALDVSIQADVLNLLADLREELGLTILFISHDLAVVRHVADRVAVMHRGRIVEMLAADDIGRAATHPYTRRLLDAVPVPDPKARPRVGVAT